MFNKSESKNMEKHRTLQQYPTLNSVTKPTVDTAAAAFYLNRRPQTLRCWAVYQDGAINPIRISGRLAWPVSELKRVLGLANEGQVDNSGSEIAVRKAASFISKKEG